MPAPIDDSLTARVTSKCPEDTRNILYHAWGHDLATLKTLLDERGKASVQDPETGETPLHAAIRACGPAKENDDNTEEDEDGSVESAKEILQELFLSGAIWNDTDANNETPGCVAQRLGRKALYDMCVDAGVRAELLFGLMDGYEELSSNPDDDADDEHAPELVPTTQDAEPRFVPPDADEKPVTSDEYLRSALTYDVKKLLDEDANGVMMAWETDIMRRSVSSLLPDDDAGARILNIGFGMGIVDGLFAARKPARHHIIEAHPDVLAYIRSPESGFDQRWEETQGVEEGAYRIFEGKWQDVLPELLQRGESYDAIYFDTFGEDYSQLRNFFTEYVPGLLDQGGRFSFFNGLGADRQICYDVYTKVVEMHCADAGLDVEWEEVDVDMSALDQHGEGEWSGVRRRYWTLNKYRLPICTFMG